MKHFEGLEGHEINIQIAKWFGYTVRGDEGDYCLYDEIGDAVTGRAWASETYAWEDAPYFMEKDSLAIMLIENHDYTISSSQRRNPRYIVELHHYVGDGTPKGSGATLADAIIQAWAEWRVAQ